MENNNEVEIVFDFISDMFYVADYQTKDMVMDGFYSYKSAKDYCNSEKLNLIEDESE